MSTIERNARLDQLDYDRIEAGIAHGRRLQARAMASALKGLFARRKDDGARSKETQLPDCTATA
ncbi:MAG: hypothetical protein HC871_14435 [Rhizobiales bacterium]|nr:hypothetical protein [Hyphomicrobiales bacterium]